MAAKPRRKKLWSTQAARVKQVLLLASPFLAVAAGKLTWSVHTSLMGVSERWQSDGSPLQILGQMLGGTAPSYRYQVPSLFSEKHHRRKQLRRGVFVFVYILVCDSRHVIGRGVYHYKREDRKRIAFAAQCRLLRWRGYLCCRFCIHMLYCSARGEALDLASISRYLNTCVVLLIQVSMAVFAYALI